MGRPLIARKTQFLMAYGRESRCNSARLDQR